MSEQNLLNYHLFKANSNNFQFDYSIPPATAANHELLLLANQQRRIPVNDYDICPTPSSYYLPPITTSVSFSSILHKKVLDQSEQQWENHVSQSAIIINEKQMTIPSPMNNSADHHSIGSQSDDRTPTHIVSPEAIREALKEEKEEAMGRSQQRPFSKFTSFHDLKQRLYSTAPPPPPSLTIPFSPPTSIETNAFDDIFHQTNPQDVENSIAQDSEMPCSSHRPMDTLEKLKRPPNAYLLFNRDMRRKLQKQLPKMTVAEISKKVGDWWKALPDVKRAYYVQEAAILKEEHLKKYPDFIYTRRSKAQLAEAKKTSKLGRKLKSETIQQEPNPLLINTTVARLANKDMATITTATTTTTTTKKRSNKSSAKGGQKDPRGRKKKRHKHPFAPKHPMSAYLYYLAFVYPQVSLNFPGSTVGPISKSISKTWHAMSPEERLPWKQKADSDKARYAQEMQVYMAANHSSLIPAGEEDVEQF